MAKKKKMTFAEQLQRLGACYEARQWVGNRTLAQAWKYRWRKIRVTYSYAYTPSRHQHWGWQVWLVHRLGEWGELPGAVESGVSRLDYVKKVRVSTIQRALDRAFAGFNV